MIRAFERMYITIKLMQIARQNEKRNKFYEKYCFDDCGEDIENAKLVRATVDENGLKEKNQTYYSTDNKLCDKNGVKYYCEQHTGYCEDDFYGTVYYKTPIKGLFVRVWYSC